MTRRRLRTCLAALAFMSVASAPAHAQLLSPGRLAEAHAELEGLRNCTSCHELGQRGISAERCLGCHEELQGRIADGRGYHATVPENACADCHQDHLGTDFDLRRLDETTFDHAITGYELRASHGSLDCRQCHRSSLVADPTIVAIMSGRGALDRTFLGLSTDCARCHAGENPHGSQFIDRDCADCHDEGEWATPPNFQHAATDYPLDGQHARVACSSCHGSPGEAVYRPVPHASCADCHTDPHGGAMGSTCASCHATEGWTAVSSGNVERLFDHSATGFPLAGAHAAVTCRTCHQPGGPPRTSTLRMSYLGGTERSTYPRPLFDTCAACHVEEHGSPDPDARWVECEACHSDGAWVPSAFGAIRHAESPFPLTGAHLVTPCVACHLDDERGHDAFTLSLPGQDCIDCHRADDPHSDAYAGTTCGQCHVTEDFALATFDHALVLDGPDSQSCTSCHSGDDPHAGQFAGRDCADCHVPETFAIEDLDHDATEFPLDGAHAPAPCAACHLTESGPTPIVRYRPIGTDCIDCHQEATP